MAESENTTVTKRENEFLRWIVGGLLASLVILGGVVWNQIADKVDRQSEMLSKHSMEIQHLQLNAAADRRATDVSLAGIQSWLQAIGARLNVPQPPPSPVVIP